MTRKVLRGSTFNRMLLRRAGWKILVGAVCLLAAVCLQAPAAMAQHGGFGGGHVGGGGHFGGGGHSAGGGVHSSAPSASHSARTGPIFHIFRRAPASARSSALAPAPITLNTNPTALYRPVPIGHPGPVRQPVFFVPVYFGSPFFYGGFNSFGCGCGAFWGAGCFYSPFSGYGYGFGGYYGGFSGGWGGGYTGLSAVSNVYASSNAGDLGTVPAQSYEAPAHRSDLVELFFKDGMAYDVTDYWVVDGRLHFLTVDESGQKTVEHVVPFDSLDLETTRDDASSRGFKFQLRNESMEQYFREHPEVVPKVVEPEGPEKN